MALFGTDFLKIDPALHSQIYAVLGEAAKIRALIQWLLPRLRCRV